VGPRRTRNFFAAPQAELIHRRAWPTRRHAKVASFEFITGGATSTVVIPAIG